MADKSTVELVDPYDDPNYVASKGVQKDIPTDTVEPPKYSSKTPKVTPIRSPANNDYTDFIPGIGQGLNNIGQRTQQLAQVPGIQGQIDDTAELNKPLLNSNWGLAGSIVGNTLGGIGAGAVLSKAVPRVAPLVAGAVKSSPYLTSAGLGALNAGLTVPVTSNDSTVGNMIEGGIGGLLGLGAINTVGKVVHMLPPLVGGAVQWADKGKQGLYNFMRENGVNMSVGDISDSSKSRWAENVAGRLPLSGRSGWIEDTTGKIKDMVKSLGDSIGVDTSDPISASKTVDATIKSAHDSAKKTAGRLYDDVSNAVANNPASPPVALPNTRQTIVGAQTALDDIWSQIQNTNAKNVVDKLGKATDQKSPLIDPSTNQPFVKTPELTFYEASKARSTLKSLSDQAWAKFRSGDIPKEHAQQITDISKAFNEDLDNWGLNPTNLGVYDKYKQANNYFRAKVMPFRDPTLLQSNSNIFKNALNNIPNPDIVGDTLYKKGQPSIVDDFLNLTNNDPKGVKAMRTVILNKIIGNAGETSTSAPQDVVIKNFNQYGPLAQQVLTPGQYRALATKVEGLSRMDSSRYSTNAIKTLENSHVKNTLGLGEVGMGTYGILNNPTIGGAVLGGLTAGGRLLHHLTSARPFVNYLMSDPTIASPMVNQIGGLAGGATLNNMPNDPSAKLIGNLKLHGL